jgi:Bacterial archaeo-eukaryotic release factor family 10
MMKDHSTLKAIYAFAPNLRRASDRALSMYMPVRFEGYDSRHYELEFGHMLRRYRDRLDDDEREVLEREMARLRAHLEIVRPAGCPAMAGFADEPAGVLELVKLPAETDARLEVGPLLLAPIERMLERFPPALIAVVDKEQAKLFAAVLDDVYPIDDIKGDAVKRHKAGGSSALSNQRKADNRAKANLEQVVKTIAKQMKSGVYQRLFVAGPVVARAEFEHLLPDPLKRTLAGHLSASLDSFELQHELRQQLERMDKP